eukprot:4976386-Amphidinium_carterae.1
MLDCPLPSQCLQSKLRLLLNAPTPKTHMQHNLNLKETPNAWRAKRGESSVMGMATGPKNCTPRPANLVTM